MNRGIPLNLKPFSPKLIMKPLSGCETNWLCETTRTCVSSQRGLRPNAGGWWWYAVIEYFSAPEECETSRLITGVVPLSLSAILCIPLLCKVGTLPFWFVVCFGSLSKNNHSKIRLNRSSVTVIIKGSVTIQLFNRYNLIFFIIAQKWFHRTWR